MVDLILSKVGYGDDFNFIKSKRANRIISEHSQERDIYLLPDNYTSYSYDIIKENFIGKNQEFFKAVYFDFAPIWAIPIYQERPVHSLKPIPDYSQVYSLKECEETCITAYSYDIRKRVEVVSVYGGDGRYHDVSVTWDEYLPLEESKNFYISTEEIAADKKVIGRHNGLCIYKS